MKIYTDTTDSKAPEGWKTLPYAEGVVHYDPSTMSDVDANMLIDDSVNARNDQLTELSIKTSYEL
jgi:hypothetical protein